MEHNKLTHDEICRVIGELYLKTRYEIQEVAADFRQFISSLQQQIASKDKEIQELTKELLKKEEDENF